MMSAEQPRMLLVAPPWRIPHTSSLALGTLCPILRAHGIDVDELHGSLLFPSVETRFDTLELYAKFLFVPALTGCEVEPFLERIMAGMLEEGNMHGILWPSDRVTFADIGIDAAALLRGFRNDIASAEVCLDRMFERAMAHPYDIVGFSATFDDQVPAALALARRLKAARPQITIVFGGAACFEEQSDGLVASFPEIDVSCHTEGEAVIVPLIEALRARRGLAGVPGIAYRTAGGQLVHNPSPPPLERLDTLPVPDFHPFIEQFSASHWAASLEPRLMFETSRGCWWGQKTLCTFCGLNAEGLAFRAKSPERAYDEIASLYRDYPIATYLQCTDNILDMKYLSTTFPRLARMARDPDRPLRIFYEVKSNMRSDQVEAMAAAGVESVQPGIESFSDGVLKLMRKGCTALGQIQFLKWTYQFDVAAIYNVILRNPGERAEWYHEMVELAPFLTHLQPPTGIVTMHLERFSPYFQNPAEHGIANVRPRSSYHDVYPGEGVDLARIAYQFDFDHPGHHDEELIVAYRSFVDAMKAWRLNWKKDMVFFVDEGTHLVILDRRDGVELRTSIGRAPAQLFLFLDQHRSRVQIAEAFPGLDAELIDALLVSWHHRRWVCRNGNRWLAVVPRKGPPLMRPERVRSPARATLRTLEAHAE